MLPIKPDLDKWKAAQEAIAKALNLLQTNHDSFLHTQVLNTQGSLQLSTGHAEAALETWKQAETRYRSLKDVTGVVLEASFSSK